MPHLLLHIGHMKTGTTWLQEGFAADAATLERAGIRYPLTDGAARPADHDARVPSGNGLTLLDAPDRIAAKLAQAVPDARLSALFSSEVMFNRIHRVDPHRLVSIAREAGFEGVRILLFVRAPLPLAVSIWQQRVKGWEGETRDLDTFVRQQFNWPERVLALADRFDPVERIELTVRNYDAHRSDLFRPVEAWLGLPERTLRRPGRESVNRSLTRGEAALQLAMNRRLGPSGEIFAFRLTNRLPDVPRDPPELSPEVAREVLEREAAALDRLDALLPAGEPLSRAVPEADPSRPLALDAAQLAVIAEGIADYMDAPLGVRLGRAVKRRPALKRAALAVKGWVRA